MIVKQKKAEGRIFVKLRINAAGHQCWRWTKAARHNAAAGSMVVRRGMTVGAHQSHHIAGMLYQTRAARHARWRARAL